MIMHFLSNKTLGLMAGVLFCLGPELQAVAQGSQGYSGAPGGGGQGGFAINDITRSVRVFDESGKAFVNPYREVSGSAYLNDNWDPGTVRLSGGVIVPNLRVRLDLKTQLVHFLDSGKIERVVPAGIVRELIMDDSSGTDTRTVVFRDGFPPVDSRKETDFYQVLSNGKVSLLYSRQKSIDIDKDEMAGTVQMEFVLHEEYYLFGGGKMQRIKKKGYSEALDVLADKKEKVKAFIDENHLKLKSLDELKEVVDYYNTLP
jgi:hypothetical protein